VAARKHKKKLLWLVPIPGTSTSKKVEAARRPGDGPATPADSPATPSGSANRPAEDPPPASGSPAPPKQ